jgi:hypothetical protein
LRLALTYGRDGRNMGDMKKGTGAWYTEKNTTTAPCAHDDSLEWIVRCGKYIALVPKENK